MYKGLAIGYFWGWQFDLIWMFEDQGLDIEMYREWTFEKDRGWISKDLGMDM